MALLVFTGVCTNDATNDILDLQVDPHANDLALLQNTPLRIERWYLPCCFRQRKSPFRRCNFLCRCLGGRVAHLYNPQFLPGAANKDVKIYNVARRNIMMSLV